MAMLIVIIATTVAVSIVHEEKFTIRKSAHVHLMDRAGLYAFGRIHKQFGRSDNSSLPRPYCSKVHKLTFSFT